MARRVLVVYHFFYPDDVVSARHLTELAEGLARRGWEVTALGSNRFCRDPETRIPITDETVRGVRYHRAHRPAFKQSSNLGRLLNAAWLMVSWLGYIARQPKFDVIVLGTDPQFSYFMLPFLRLLRKRSKLVSWGFDLYPEAIIASDMGIFSRLGRMIRPFTGFCYKRLDAMVDIGPCMRQLLDGYGHHAERETLVPWALAEPERPLEPDTDTRRELFGDTQLALLYSGTIGKAHEFKRFVKLARILRERGASVALCFAGRGNQYEALRAMVTDEDTNISFAGFADEDQLVKRLGSGDIHLISLRRQWEGVVVPSKFFGSLAAGKPVLYDGGPDSAISLWSKRYGLGFTLNNDNLDETADTLCAIAADRGQLAEKQEKAFRCYHEHFSREAVLNGWDTLLQRLTTSGDQS